MHGRWLTPNSQIGAVYAHAEAIQSYDEGEGLHPFKPCHKGVCTPCVHFSAGGAQKTGFFPQSLLYVSGDFHTFGPFSS